MRLTHVLQTTVLVSVIGMAASWCAAQPAYINYKGSVQDLGGDPLASGTYPMQFAIHGEPQSASLVWGPMIFDGQVAEGHGAEVNVLNGEFNILLGPTDTTGRSIADAFATGEDRYIEVTIDGDVISPRQQFLSVPYAIQVRSSVSAEFADIMARLEALETQILGKPVDGRLSSSEPEARTGGNTSAETSKPGPAPAESAAAE